MSTNNRVASDGTRGSTLRVLHVGPGYGQRGGVASVLGELSRSGELFRRAGISLEFFETRGFKRPLDLLRFFFIDIPRFFMAARADVDIVHFHVCTKGSFARKYCLYLIASWRGRKTLFHWHANNLEEFRFAAGAYVARAVSGFIRRADAVVGVSREISEDLLHHRNSGDRVYTIGNSAQEAEESAYRQAFIEKKGETPYIAFAARFVPEKGISDLFAAIALLKNEGCPVRVKLAGTGHVDVWKWLVRDLGIDELVSFVGWLDGPEKVAFFRDARAFCLPSHREPFGIVTLEAMFNRLPVIGTRRGGFLDLVEEGVTGLLVEPHDIRELAHSIRRVVEDPDMATRMGSAGFARAMARFSTQAVVAQYVDCYRDTSRL